MAYFSEFILTDGSLRLDLLGGNRTGKGITLKRYTPGRLQAKSGGVWANNPLGPGRRLKQRAPGNVADALEIEINYPTPEEIIGTMELLDTLLEKALAYWDVSWQSEPVWIEAVATGETSKRYALIYGVTGDNYPDPYQSPYAQEMPTKRHYTLGTLAIAIERSAWMANAPGVATAISVSNASHPDATTTGVFVGNSSGGLDAIYRDYQGSAVGGNLLAGSLPYAIFNGSSADNAVMIGSLRPFRSIIFNIGTPMQATSWAIKWEFSTQETINTSGATWGDLTGFVGDESQSFALTGARVVRFTPSDVWKKFNYDGTAKFWVRARITAMTSNVTVPVQTTRHVYIPSSPYIEIAAAQVGGNLDALALLRLGLHSSAYGIFAANSRYMQQVMVGLRTLSRGANFNAYIHPRTADNTSGITVTLTDSAGHANTATISSVADADASPSGYLIDWTAATNDTLDEVFRVELDASIASQFYGRFRLLLRTSAGVGTQFRYRLQFAGAATYARGETKTLTTAQTDGTVDLGTIEIPPSARVARGETVSTIHLIIDSLTTAGLGIAVSNVILLPTDEWSAHITGQTPAVSQDYYVDIDSIGNPKFWQRALVRKTSDLSIVDDLPVITSQQAALHANAAQRLWFVLIDAIDPMWSTVEAQVQIVKRYYHLRGD